MHQNQEDEGVRKREDRGSTCGQPCDGAMTATPTNVQRKCMVVQYK